MIHSAESVYAEHTATPKKRLGDEDSACAEKARAVIPRLATAFHSANLEQPSHVPFAALQLLGRLLLGDLPLVCLL
jgi:hypothetical protein